MHAAFLQAICETPGDDVLRLVYADWLDEHGEAERAEFIRVQCELAALRCERAGGEAVSYTCDRITPEPCEACARAFVLRRREYDLWGGYTFAPPMPDPFRGVLSDPSENGDCLIRRGFVESITCTVADFLQYALAIRQAQPVTRIRLTNADMPKWFQASLQSDVVTGMYRSDRFPGIDFELPLLPAVLDESSELRRYVGPSSLRALYPIWRCAQDLRDFLNLPHPSPPSSP